MGLDDPLIVRYLRWMGLWKDVDGTFNGVLQGNFGYSNLYKRNVVDVIKTPMSNTIFINIFSHIGKKLLCICIRICVRTFWG